ncbi:MAG: hypothetical protein AAF934_09645, partial [Bacteroidota bacterium]
MKRTLFFFVPLVLCYMGFAVYNSNALSDTINNPEYQRYIDAYRKCSREGLLQRLKSHEIQANSGLEYRPAASKGTTGNFEGPQVLLKGVKFHEEFLTKEDDRLMHIDGVSAHFDPDHRYYGLPDVRISIKDVRLYQPKQGILSRLPGLKSNSDPKPYKIYKKSFISDSLGVTGKYFEMQLWLTEFEVSVTIRPDRDVPLSVSN